MSATTIQIPAAQVEAIQRSLDGQRGDAVQGNGTDVVLARAAVGGGERHVLTGSPAALWSVVYDSLCAAAERLAEDCNEYWRGGADAETARAGVADVGALLELLVGLGPRPSD
jgi:hypothetical protein